MDERANISSSRMLRGDAAWSTLIRRSLPVSSFSLPFVTVRLSFFISSRRLVLSRYAILRPLLTIRGTLLFSLSLVLSAFLPLSVSLSLFSSSRRTCLLEGPELAGGHYGGYSVGFSRLSKAHERVCPPRVKELPREQVHLLPYLSPLLLFPLFLFFLSLFLLSPFLTAPRTTANPPYAPSGSYLRVLLIFSYYCRGHIGMFHTYIRKSSSYVHKARSTSRFTGLLPSYSAPFPMFLSSPLPSPPPSILLSGTPICEHIITEGVSLSRGSKDEVKRTRVPPGR